MSEQENDDIEESFKKAFDSMFQGLSDKIDKIHNTVRLIKDSLACEESLISKQTSKVHTNECSNTSIETSQTPSANNI